MSDVSNEWGLSGVAGTSRVRRKSWWPDVCEIAGPDGKTRGPSIRPSSVARAMSNIGPAVSRSVVNPRIERVATGARREEVPVALVGGEKLGNRGFRENAVPVGVDETRHQHTAVGLDDGRKVGRVEVRSDAGDQVSRDEHSPVPPQGRESIL